MTRINEACIKWLVVRYITMKIIFLGVIVVRKTWITTCDIIVYNIAEIYLVIHLTNYISPTHEMYWARTLMSQRLHLVQKLTQVSFALDFLEVWSAKRLCWQILIIWPPNMLKSGPAHRSELESDYITLVFSFERHPKIVLPGQMTQMLC